MRRGERILTALARHPTEEFSGFEIAGLAHVGAGTVYPALYRLEREGRVVARWEVGPVGRRRRLYKLAIKEVV